MNLPIGKAKQIVNQFFLILLFSFFLTNAFSDSKLNLSQIRRQYIESLNDVSITDDLLNQLKARKVESPLILGYYGALQGIKAKHAYNPWMKLDYLNQSKSTLAQAIHKDPKNSELRFLRFSMEHYIPTWLGYSPNLKKDKISILENVESVEDKEVKKVIIKFLLDSKRLTPQEEKSIKLILPI